MGTRLSKAPVFFTLAQMRFNPVLEMAAFVPALQRAFGKLGFPDYYLRNVQGFEVLQAPDGISVNSQGAERHMFRNMAKTAALVLDASALTYELTDYPDSQEFRSTFLKALDILHTHRPIEYFDRLGIRMLDAVQPVGSDSLDRYIAPQALGFASLLSNVMAHQHTLTESLFLDGSRGLSVRTLRSPHRLAVPPDLMPLRLEIQPRFTEHQGEAVILDTDSFVGERKEYSSTATEAELKMLKSILSDAFVALTTDHAREIWK